MNWQAVREFLIPDFKKGFIFLVLAMLFTTVVLYYSVRYLSLSTYLGSSYLFSLANELSNCNRAISYNCTSNISVKSVEDAAGNVTMSLRPAINQIQSDLAFIYEVIRAIYPGVKLVQLRAMSITYSDNQTFLFFPSFGLWLVPHLVLMITYWYVLSCVIVHILKILRENLIRLRYR